MLVRYDELMVSDEPGAPKLRCALSQVHAFLDMCVSRVGVHARMRVCMFCACVHVRAPACGRMLARTLWGVSVCACVHAHGTGV